MSENQPINKKPPRRKHKLVGVLEIAREFGKRHLLKLIGVLVIAVGIGVGLFIAFDVGLLRIPYPGEDLPVTRSGSVYKHFYSVFQQNTPAWREQFAKYAWIRWMHRGTVNISTSERDSSFALVFIECEEFKGHYETLVAQVHNRSKRKISYKGSNAFLVSGYPSSPKYRQLNCNGRVKGRLCEITITRPARGERLWIFMYVAIPRDPKVRGELVLEDLALEDLDLAVTVVKESL